MIAPRVVASSNPGLELANAFGVWGLELANAFGVRGLELANAFGVRGLELTNAFGVLTRNTERLRHNAEKLIVE